MKFIYKLELKRKRIPLVAKSEAIYHAFDSTIFTSNDAFKIAESIIGDEVVECFIVIPLNIKNQVMDYVEIGRGGVSSCPVDVPSVFRVAIHKCAHAIILAHNHPSGDPTPSDQDKYLTERLVKASEYIGITILDHIIVGNHGFSFADQGLLKYNTTHTKF